MNQQAKRTVQATALGGGIILAIVGAIIGGQALGAIVNAPPAAEPTAVVNAQPGLAQGPTKTPPPVVVVEVPAATVVEDPAPVEEVPFVESDDPNNAQGGDYDSSACASGRMTVDGSGNVVCDG